MAGLSAGAVIVGIDAHASAEQVGYVAEHSGACCLVVEGRENLRMVLPRLRGAFKFVLLLDAEGEGRDADRVLTWDAVMSRRRDHPPLHGDPLSTDDPATLIYTSGTTGWPKGIEYTHRQLLVARNAMLEAFPYLREGDRVLCWLPMAPLFQRMMNLVAIACGATTYFVEDPRTIVDRLREVEPRVFIGVPRFYEKLHERIQKSIADQSPWRRRVARAALAAGAERARLHQAGKEPSIRFRLKHAILDRLVLRRIRRVMGRNLEFMVTGSAPSPLWLLEFFHTVGLLLLEAYGLSENTVPMAANRPDSYRLGSVGRPFSANEIRFAADGEILVKGPGLFRGYYGEGGPGDRFTPEGFYRTGDCGRLDEDGFLFLTGRTSDMIKTSTGRRISPAQTEAAHRQCPFLDNLVVVGNGRKHLAALVTLNCLALEAEFQRRGLPAPPREELWRSRLAESLIRRGLEICGQDLAPHEQIRAFAILPEPLSVANGELTATLKPRRHQIEARYRDLIDRLYAAEVQDPQHPHASEPRLDPNPVPLR